MIRNAYVIIVALLLAAPVSVADVSAAKTNGYACEHTDGYLRATVNAPEGVKALVDNVNAKRRERYAEIATNNGVVVDQVARLTAQKLIGRAPQHACE